MASPIARTTRTPFVVMALAAVATVTVARTPRAQAPAGQAPAATSGVRFHHVHLNSVNPAAAAEYYPKAFTTAVKTTFNGLDAVKSGNVYILFNKVNTPPPTGPAGPQSAHWHFGWNTPDSRAYLDKFHTMKLDVVPMY